MKKLIALLLAVAMVACLFVGCAGDKEDPTETTTEPTTESTAPSEEPTTESTAPSEDPTVPTPAMNIALVTDVGNIDDKSFNQGAWEGVVAYAEANGVPYAYYRPSEDSDVARIESIDTAIANGANVVVCPGYLFETSVFEVQSTYPEVKFLLLDGEPHTADYATYETKTNTMNILYREEQAGYMAGYAAVKDGYRHLGFIGGIEVPAVVRFGFGFVQGVNAAAVELGVEGEVDVKYWYSGTFSPDDSIKTKAAGWYTAGTEVIFACGGGIYVSICAAAVESGKAVIGVDKDQSFESETIITSAMKNLTASVELALTEMAANNGEWAHGGETIILGAAENCVGLPTAEASWRLQNYTVAEYEALFAAIANETIAVSNSLEQPEVAIAVDYAA